MLLNVYFACLKTLSNISFNLFLHRSRFGPVQALRCQGKLRFPPIKLYKVIEGSHPQLQPLSPPPPPPIPFTDRNTHFFCLGTSSLFLCTRVSMFSGSWHSRFALFSLIFFYSLFYFLLSQKKISKQLNTIFSRFCKQVFCSLLLPAPPQSPPKFCIVLTLSLSSCSILMICPLLISFLFWSIFSSQ